MLRTRISEHEHRSLQAFADNKCISTSDVVRTVLSGVIQGFHVPPKEIQLPDWAKQ
jgi:hypothetical protein